MGPRPGPSPGPGRERGGGPSLGPVFLFLARSPTRAGVGGAKYSDGSPQDTNKAAPPGDEFFCEAPWQRQRRPDMASPCFQVRSTI